MLPHSCLNNHGEIYVLPLTIDEVHTLLGLGCLEARSGLQEPGGMMAVLLRV